MTEIELVKLLRRLSEPYDFTDAVKKSLKTVLDIPTTIYTPKSIKGVYSLLCAIRTYKI